MKFDFNNDKCPIWGTGLFHRLEMLSCIIERWKINPEVFFYDKKGKNRWNDIFTNDLDDTYSKTKSLKVKKYNNNIGQFIEEVDEHIYLKSPKDDSSIDFILLFGKLITLANGYKIHEGNHLINNRPLKNRFKFTDSFLKEVDILYNSLNKPTVGIFIRETDKFDGHPTKLQRTPISSRMIYDRIKELGLDKDTILIISDSLLTINYLLEKGLDVVYHQKHKSTTLFPNFIWSKISRFYPDNSAEYKFFVDHEFQMGYEFLLEMGIMLKLNPEMVFQNILHGPTQFYFYLKNAQQVRELIDFNNISLREKEIVRYHQYRESILWKTLYNVLSTYSIEERF